MLALVAGSGPEALVELTDFSLARDALLERGRELAPRYRAARPFRLRLERRLNLLLYLNRDWRPEYGGQLELWDERMEPCERTVEPEANRIVVFNTTSTSYHGNPRPVASPPGVYRRSLAFYYYTADRTAHERQSPHSTLYQTPRASGGEPPTGVRSTRFRHTATRWLPPAIADAARRVRSRRRGS